MAGPLPRTGCKVLTRLCARIEIVTCAIRNRAHPPDTHSMHPLRDTHLRTRVAPCTARDYLSKVIKKAHRY